MTQYKVGQTVRFWFSHDDGPGTPVRQVEREGTLVMVLQPKTMSDGKTLQLLVVEAEGSRWPIRTDQVVAVLKV